MSFFAWLCSLNKTQLGQIIAHRPEVVASGAPRDRAELASFLQHPAMAAIHLLTASQPVHDVVNMLASSGGRSSAETLAKSFDLAADDAGIEQAVEWLTTRALAWQDAEGLHLVPGVLQLIPRPFGLGGPVQPMLEAQTVARLTAIASRWGLPTVKTKSRIVAAMTQWLADPGNVRRLTATAPADVRTVMETLAWESPVTTALRTPPVAWALEHGMMYVQNWNMAEMPAEIGRALRGPDWRPRFASRPPEPTTVAIVPAMAQRESAASAMIVLDQVGALAAECARKPVPALKTGGIGVRELRRLAKTVGCDERSTRLWLEVAFEAGLLGMEGDDTGNGRLLATASYDTWLTEEPAVRFARLLTAWQQMVVSPFADADADTRVPALIEPDDPRELATLVRHAILAAAARLPRDRGLVSEDGLIPVLAWRLPALRVDSAAITGLWQEARAMGVVAHGALTEAGRALAAVSAGAGLAASAGALAAASAGAGPAASAGALAAVSAGAGPAGEQLLAAARDLVGSPSTSAIFQTDLTAVVPGIPAHALVRLLDSAADRESRGGALTWRFSSASVRRALDAGMAADELTAQLTAASGGGEIPQALSYLVADIGRQFGRLRVRAVGCVIHGVEESLITEVLNAKALRGLHLTRLAPNVLAAAAPQQETLAALRSAGYFPAAEQADGNPQTIKADQPRAGSAGGQQLSPYSALADRSSDQIEPFALAEQLCGRPPGQESRYPALLPGLPFAMGDPMTALLNPGAFDQDEDGDDNEGSSEQHIALHEILAEHTDRLDPESVCTLALAVEFSDLVRITYRPTGSRTKLRILMSPEAVTGEYLSGRDFQSGGMVKLRLGEIERVHAM